ncbi:SMC-Scp complex subunit ScpB [Blastopirellula sp. JC732]|uniref:SMC-Scp complex subunit ScpB n=1 Tax=Blastopirellula sediminis TaxID=2894196 RepID=A0A9X1MMA0_9BACT|nr:SMC-Scp complex subunit ScpB [Blastopirellula sediminis]MCC9607463.1 SMC-Scp complex subunit ScpB [Blastopirellula sediminis]MCC9629244.1 SMC-Scp complex subunit ScpB [Blastopirellula sediminis]
MSSSELPPDDDDFGDDLDEGLSLEKLSAAFAAAMGGDEPYESGEEEEPAETEEEDESSEEAVARVLATEEEPDDCELSPRTILEAMLFVGSPDNSPLSAEKGAARMRGVAVDEIADLVEELNQAYREEGCPYEIVSSGGGFRMSLRDDFGRLREKFYGKVREAKLSQPAVDVLALVAYNQNITREEVDKMRGKPSGPLLNQLVRRELLQLERTGKGKEKQKTYSTTDRFLEMFRLTSLEDLPQPQGLDLED